MQGQMPRFWELLGGKGKIAAAVPDADNAPMGVPTRLFKMQAEGDPVEVRKLGLFIRSLLTLEL